MASGGICPVPQTVPVGVGKALVVDAVVKSVSLKRRPNPLKRHFLNVALLMSAVALAGCSGSGTNSAASKPAAPAAKPMVTTAAAAPSTDNDGVVASGPLIVENQVEV